MLRTLGIFVRHGKVPQPLAMQNDAAWCSNYDDACAGAQCAQGMGLPAMCMGYQVRRTQQAQRLTAWGSRLNNYNLSANCAL